MFLAPFLLFLDQLLIRQINFVSQMSFHFSAAVFFFVCILGSKGSYTSWIYLFLRRQVRVGEVGKMAST